MVVKAEEQRRAVGRPSARAATWVAWSLCARSLGLTVLSLLLLTLTLFRPGVTINYYWLETTVLAASYSPVGAIVAPRLRESPIGWLICAIGLSFAVVHFTAEYAIYALLARAGSLPWGEASVWIWSWVPAIGLVVFLDLLFPNGNLPGPRWRYFARFTDATAVAIGRIILKNTIFPLVGEPWIWWAGLVLAVVGLGGNPIGMDVPVLKYRLYNIDLLINRTLVYGSLTALLALIYFGGVALTEAVFRALTGQEQQSQIAIVGSTPIRR